MTDQPQKTGLTEDDDAIIFAKMTREEAIQYAKNWIETARMHLRNEEYWRERCLKAEGKSDAEIADWGH